MRVRISGGEGEQAARIAAALLAGGLEIAAPDAPHDCVLILGAAAAAELRADGLTLDLARRRACRGGTPLALTPIEFALLAYLAQAGRAVSRAELLRELWGYRFDPQTNSVAVHVSRLRAKLGRAAIVTDADGYRLADALRHA